MILEGKSIAKKIDEGTKQKIKNNTLTPFLTTLSINPSPSILSYIKSQEKKASQLGISYKHIQMPESSNTGDFIKVIDDLNRDKNIHGILISHPLREDIDELRILSFLDPKKDIEGRSPVNLGLIIYEKAYFYPCTAQAALEILDNYNISTEGKRIAIIGRSSTVGKPLALMLLKKDRNATPVICHTRTKNLQEVISTSEIIIAAAGRAELIKLETLPQNSIVIDVGINFLNGKLVGDVSFDLEIAEKKNISITPVPGGVGPVTTSILMRNAVDAAF